MAPPKCQSMHLIQFHVAQAAAEAQAQARKGMLRGQPSDKRKLNQKGIQRIDSMQFGGVSPPSVLSEASPCEASVISTLSAAMTSWVSQKHCILHVCVWSMWRFCLILIPHICLAIALMVPAAMLSGGG